jgi:hypothetical protein
LMENMEGRRSIPVNPITGLLVYIKYKHRNTKLAFFFVSQSLRPNWPFYSQLEN